MNQRLTPQQIEQLKQLGTATLHEAQGQRGALESGIKPIDPTRKLVGTAFTVDCRPGDNLVLHYALSVAQAGDVLVVDAKGFVEGGPWGDIMTTAARHAGLAGLVIDGAVRDSDAIQASGFPVFARGLSIKGTNKAQPGKVRTPVTCGGVQVHHGDIIVGDRDGVVVIPAVDLDTVLRAAQAREEKEAGFRQALAAGQTTVELLGLGPVLEKLGLH